MKNKQYLSMSKCVPAAAIVTGTTEHGTIIVEPTCLGQPCVGQLTPSEARILARRLESLALEMDGGCDVHH